MEAYRKFPYKIEKDSKLAEKWAAFQSSKVIISETESKIYRVSEHYIHSAEAIYNFKVRPDDVWVVSYPRSGTTLTQEMVWLITNNNDYETAKKITLKKRFPYFEINSAISEEVLEEAKKRVSSDKEKLKSFLEVMSPQWVALENWTKRRFIKSHLPFALLPPELLTSGCKVLFIARNPKDVAVSLFNFLLNDAPKEDFEEFWNLFQNASINYTPFWDHVKQGWDNRNKENYCFLFYEDIVRDMKGTIRKVAMFLEKDMSEEQVDKLADHLNISNLRTNMSVNTRLTYYLFGTHKSNMIRKGGIGGWKDYFTEEINMKANKWIEENYKKTDLRFPVNLES